MIFEVTRPLGNDFFEWAYYLLVVYWPLFFNGIKFTLLVAITGTVIGLIIGLIVGGVRANKINPTDATVVKCFKKFLHILSAVYIEVFRGTPMMVQAVFIYYSLKPVLQWSPLVCGIFVVSINTGAYMAEIVRSGIQSVPIGQSEAALSLGMTPSQSMFNVVLPQAIRNAFPAIGNEFVVNIKDSSVLNVISVTEIFFQAKSIGGTFYKFTEAYFVCACVYLVLTLSITWILGRIEKRMDSPINVIGSQTVPKAIIQNKRRLSHE